LKASETEDMPLEKLSSMAVAIDRRDLPNRVCCGAVCNAHPLYELVNFLLDRQTAVDGAAFYNRCRQLCLAAIDTCLDDLLELED
jgi:hypothetical protein